MAILQHSRAQLALAVASWWLGIGCIWLCFLSLWPAAVNGMTPSRLSDLREQTGAMFYHGFDNYMRYAFPEDEVCVWLVCDVRVCPEN